MVLGFTGERIVPGAADCEPTFAQKMYQEHIARYAFAAQFAPDAAVLDVGCGVGYGSRWLAKAGAASVLGFDLSEAAIDHARMNYFHPAVTYKVQDATAIERGEGYDLATCFELIEHIDQQEEVLDLIKAALREDGTLVISTPRPLDEIRTHFHVHEMTFEELYGMLKARFNYVEPFYQINSFSSFIGKGAPDQIDRIVSITDRIDMDNADYFVFVASNAPIAEKLQFRALLSMNDDSYVLTLEKDIGVLRKGEQDKAADIGVLRGMLADTSAKLADKESEAFALRTDAARLSEALGRASLVENELNALRYRFDQSEATLARFRRSLSWSVTRPLRWVGRTSGRLFGKGRSA